MLEVRALEKGDEGFYTCYVWLSNEKTGCIKTSVRVHGKLKVKLEVAWSEFCCKNETSKTSSDQNSVEYQLSLPLKMFSNIRNHLLLTCYCACQK